jgi:hypothetical protein
MKWIPKKNRMQAMYDSNEHRIIKRYLVFTRTVREERRWLETVYIEQYVHRDYHDNYNYRDYCWSDEEDYLEMYPHKKPKLVEPSFPGLPDEWDGKNDVNIETQINIKHNTGDIKFE